ncbi:PP2C family protein-serine/threonine phosphatase [Oceanobacillus alkalisoli]|uniref:PP2C family protein-serine/threonine phosphatase n=1 Tax=Oceanobacillus alkalisoli TaxID=2925113 RepID=UPI001EE3DD1E|nr:PP2C family protein-serine/threonine phosphatase [Oceanobacillus alkalisoli]MCG5104839.1 PP2C family protein-serine/threonine phosphatase [Oceanobacillus alkalisoli]
MENFFKEKTDEYKNLLAEYLEQQDEKALYGVELVSKALIKHNILPEEIINIHIKALKELDPNLFVAFEHSLEFLLEAMISYGLAHQEIQTLREQQIALKSEISVAAQMQKTLLKTKKPDVPGLDIGVISVPANQMNGDYYSFLQNADGTIGIAMADVIGKGVPAALCMSMIKYTLDSLPKESLPPPAVLHNLNRVVERNIESNMFITMMYAEYNPETSKLVYSFAGHEPGYFYRAAEDQFTEFSTSGLVLGVSEEVEFEQAEIEIDEGDMVVLLTDGVTECRDGDRFIEIDEVLDVIRQFTHLSAQEMVQEVYRYFERLQDFQLQDDFSLLILRKTV